MFYNYASLIMEPLLNNFAIYNIVWQICFFDFTSVFYYWNLWLSTATFEDTLCGRQNSHKIPSKM